AGRGPARDARRREPIGRAARARPVTGLGDVAGTRRRTADERGTGALEPVRRTGVVDAVAALGDVAVAGGRPAFGGALRIGRTGGARAGAVLGEVAVAGRRPADGAARLELIRRTGVVHAVAVLGDVAVAGGRPTFRGAFGVGGTGIVDA